MPKLPGIVYVQWYKDKNDGEPKSKGTYLNAESSETGAVDQDCGAFDSGERVGVYRLVEVMKLTELPRKVTRKRVRN